MTQLQELFSENVQQYTETFPELNMIFRAMEKEEQWAFDVDNDPSLFSELRARLTDLHKSPRGTLHEKVDVFLWVSFFLPTRHSFFFLSHIRRIDKNIDNSMLTQAFETLNDEEVTDRRHAQVFLDRCKHLNASGYTSAIFSDKFTDAFNLAIKETINEDGNVF